MSSAAVGRGGWRVPVVECGGVRGGGGVGGRWERQWNELGCGQRGGVEESVL